MEIGKTLTITETVEESKLACNVGSGAVEVFATPMMIALIEKCAAACVQDELPEGDATVGTLINVSHVAATPVGMKVSATATVTAVEGRKICFSVKAE
ncbi:MAG: dihydrolipoamide acyltransferase, partial [Clostridia bacterium]|nr:dihydrolipoamide acyltransferase [Clostridia bacterium]